MHTSDGAISTVFLQHQLHHWFSHDVAAPHNHTFFATCRNTVTTEEGENPQRCCTHKSWQTDEHFSHIDGMETIDIFARIDGFNDPLLIDVSRQGELHYKTVYRFIFVHQTNTFQQFEFRDRVFVANERRIKSTSFASEHFILHISFASAIVPHKNSSKMRCAMPFIAHLLHLRGYFGLDFCGNGFTVYDCG